MLPVLAVVLVVLSVCVGGSQAKMIFDPGGSELLFSSAADPIESALPTDESTLRARFVTINSEQLGTTEGSGQGQRGSNLVLNLFPDAIYTAIPQSVVSMKTGQLTWHGKLLNSDESAVTITVVDQAVTGSVQVGERLFKWHDTGNGLHLLSQVEPVEPLPELEPVPVRTPGNDPARGPDSDDGTQIDVLVVYTPASRERYGGQAGIESLINQAIAESNQAYADSEIFTQVNLVHTAEVQYTESGNMGTDLSRLRSTSDGYMDEVHALRDAYKADMVNLFEESMDYCGTAYLMTTLSNNFKVSAFSVVYSQCATGYYSFGHELGHNMGSHHDRANASGPGVFPYSFGYWASNRTFRTIMAYNCPSGCTRIRHFSNPDVDFNGLPTGIDYDVNPANSADNARSINEAKLTIANWRDSGTASPQPPAPPSDLIAASVSQSEISLTWSDNTDNESGFIIERSPNGSTVWNLIGNVGPNVLFFDDSGLDPGSTFYYRVYAYNGAGNSPVSNVATATTWELQPPAAPTELTAIPASQTAIDLHWVDNADNENSFHLERSPNGTTGWEQIATVGSNIVDYHNSGLTPGTGYYYRVFARNDDGDSTYSNVAVAATWELQPPAAPTDLSASAISQTEIDLFWTDNADNEDGFIIEHSLDGASGWTQIGNVGPNVVTFSDSGLAPGTTHHYRVCATNGDGNSPFSNTADATTDTTDPPNAPSNLSASPTSHSDIDLLWVDNADNELGFMIERSLDGTGGWNGVASVGAQVVSYTDEGLSASTDYYYRVQAFNDDGYSDYSNIAMARTDDPPQTIDQLAAGDIFVAGSVSGDYSNTWSDDGSWQSIKERESGGNPNNRYSYLEHKWTFELEAGQLTTLWANVWSPESIDDDQFVFSYSTDDIEYRQLFIVQDSGDSAVYAVTMMQNTGSGTLYLRVTDTDRTPGHREKDTVYIDHMFVRSDGPLGNPPLAPGALSAVPLSDSEIYVTWQDQAVDEYGFVVERKSGGSGWLEIGSVGSDVESYLDSNLASSTTYSYRVYAFNGAGASDYSGPVSATTLNADTIHVAALSGISQPAPSNRWNAAVTITVHDIFHYGVAGATVTVSWSEDGDTTNLTCTTIDDSGTCTMWISSISHTVEAVIFSVISITHNDYVYDEGANDVGTEVTISQPLASYYAEEMDSVDRE
jgi:hypothetical protein